MHPFRDTPRRVCTGQSHQWIHPAAIPHEIKKAQKTLFSSALCFANFVLEFKHLLFKQIHRLAYNHITGTELINIYPGTQPGGGKLLSMGSLLNNSVNQYCYFSA